MLQQVAKQDQARSAGKWLSGELEKLRNKVSEAEGKVEDYRAKSNLFVGSNNTSLANQQLTELSSQVSAARAQKADAEARARLIRDALAQRPVRWNPSDIANSELIRRLSEQRVTLRGQLAEQSSTLLPQHPRIKEMKAQIADLDQQIRAEGERLARSLENEAKVAGARLRYAERQPRSVQDAERLDQRPGRATARARARGQGAARPVRILSRQIPRGDRARQHCGGAGRRPHHLARRGVEHSVFPEEDADRPDRRRSRTFCLSTAFVVTERAAERRHLSPRVDPGRRRSRRRAASPRSATPGPASTDRLPAGAQPAAARRKARRPLAPPQPPSAPRSTTSPRPCIRPAKAAGASP